MDKEAGRVFRCCRKYTIIVSILALGISYYSVWVSEAKTRDSSYKALCDISESVSCSDVLTSSYSKGFGVVGTICGEKSPLYQSNGYYGLFFYAATLTLSLYPAEILSRVLLLASIVSVLVSVYLGYILTYVLHDLCIVCVSTYVLNCVLLILAIRNHRAVKRLKVASQVPDYSTYLDGKTVKKRV